MARIAGVNIPQDKIVHIALTYIHGIGDHNSKLICEKLNIPISFNFQMIISSESLSIRKVTLYQSLIAINRLGHFIE